METKEARVNKSMPIKKKIYYSKSEVEELLTKAINEFVQHTPEVVIKSYLKENL